MLCAMLAAEIDAANEQRVAGGGGLRRFVLTVGSTAKHNGTAKFEGVRVLFPQGSTRPAR
jgi:hypothetical protein